MVRAIIDNNVDKQGQVCFGVRVRSPQKILSACPSGKGALIDVKGIYNRCMVEKKGLVTGVCK